MMQQHIEGVVRQAIEALRQEGVVSPGGKIAFEVTIPKVEAHGDFSTNAALALARESGLKPRELAEALISHMPKDPASIASISVAGPGFINFHIAPRWYLERLCLIEKAGGEFGRIDLGNGQKVQVEFVSANPTGPLHIGHGRGAVYGDVLGNLLLAAGFEVTKEYYVNDIGGQIKTLGRSVWYRLRELAGERITFPEECYQGHYIVDIARQLQKAKGDGLLAMTEEEAGLLLGKEAARLILEDIQEDLTSLGVVHDTYFFEHALHDDGLLERTLGWLAEHGHTYEQEGALWFRSTAFGDDKDRVLRKSDGSLTYFASDIAYHKQKYDRGFDRIIDIWGADHGGYVARMQAAVEAIGHDRASFQTVLIQLVNLVREGEVVSMSTRAATYETLRDVRHEVGRDVCRYFFLMRSHQAQLDFDLNLAKRETPDNPVFYIQYAHARIASIFRKAETEGHSAAHAASVDLEKLSLPEEVRLTRLTLSLPKVIEECATALEPHKLAFYLLELAKVFQGYYSKGRTDANYRVISPDEVRTAAKLYLLKNVQVVLQNGLRVLGIDAPQEMTREEVDIA